jgi:DNA polymerase IV
VPLDRRLRLLGVRVTALLPTGSYVAEPQSVQGELPFAAD